MSKSDSDLADEFIEKLCVGNDLMEHSPIVLLRNRLIKVKTNSRYKLTNKDMLKNIIQTWNYVREGITVGKLTIPSDFEMVIK
jgi:hypothetical protein